MLFGRRKKNPIRIADKGVAEWKYATCGYCSVGCAIEVGVDAAGKPVTAMSGGNYDALEEGFLMIGDGANREMVEQATAMMEPVIAANADRQAEPRKVRQGEFRDADSFHRGSGQAVIFATPGGMHLLRLENLDVTNGPALHVILSPHEDPTRPSEVKLGGYVDLGPLKGNRGNQNYPIPAGVDVSTVNSVVIYCKPFSVVFSTASLQGL